MQDRYEEEPDGDPDEDERALASPAAPLPTVADRDSAGREFEYRTELLTAEQMVDGDTLPTKLTTASAGGWDLVDVYTAGGRHAVLLRRPKKAERDARPVGFAPPGH